MKYHILGASGFIGSNILFFLKKEKKNVLGYDSKSCNLLDLKSAQKILSKVGKNDCLVFCSAITRLRDNTVLCLHRNISMVENLCMLLALNRVKSVIFISTIDVYGINYENVPLNEALPPDPSDNYALSKLFGEYYLNQSLKKQNISLVIFRLPGVYGVNGYGKSTINQLISDAVNHGSITIYGEGRAKRDFVYARDLGGLVSHAAEEGLSSVYNVGTGKSYSIKEIARYIAQRTYPNAELIHLDQKITLEKRQRDICMDNQKLIHDFPDYPLTSIKKGIQHYMSINPTGKAEYRMEKNE